MNTYQFTVMAHDREDDGYKRIILGQADGTNKEEAFRNLVAEEKIDARTIENEYYKMNTVQSSIVNFETKEITDEDTDYEYLAKEAEIAILKDDSDFYDWLNEKAKEEIDGWDVESLVDFVRDSLNVDDEGLIEDYRTGY